MRSACQGLLRTRDRIDRDQDTLRWGLYCKVRVLDETTHAITGDLHCAITMVIVQVDLQTGRPMPMTAEVRLALEKLVAKAAVDAQ